MSTRILLIEDEHSVASVIRKALTEEQYEVSVAMDAASAWDHLTRWPYDLFILDVMLPGARQINWFIHAPVQDKQVHFFRARFIKRQIAWCYSLSRSLRGQDPDQAL